MNHNTGKGIFAVLVFFFIITACAVVASPAIAISAPSEMMGFAAVGEGIAVPLPQPTPAGETSGSYTKLEIMLCPFWSSASYSSR